MPSKLYCCKLDKYFEDEDEQKVARKGNQIIVIIVFQTTQNTNIFSRKVSHHVCSGKCYVDCSL